MIGRHASVLLLLVSFMSLCDLSVGLPDWVTDDMIAMVADDKARCMGEHGTTQELIDKVNDGAIVNEPALTCYMNCLFESFGVVDEDTGEFEVELLIGFFPEKIQKIGRENLLTCADEEGTDRCNRMYNVAMCIYGRRPDMWFML